jgi:hypothetical protein
MNNNNWKPQPGKPAMTRDEKTLVTDLEPLGSVIYSKASDRYWFPDGRAFGTRGLVSLVKPTDAILAAHGIDADGKPVAKVDEADEWHLWGGGECPVARDTIVSSVMRNGEVLTDLPAKALYWRWLNSSVDIVKYKVISKGADPAPSTRVDDRWFQAACAALTGLVTRAGYTEQFALEAGRYADALMVEVTKREEM